MTKVKLVDGTILNASAVELASGVLKITTSEHSVEELAELFLNKENISLITLMTESEIESGFKKGFTSFSGISYNPEGVKTVELFQPVDEMESRVANVEAENSELALENSTLASEITDTQVAVAELAEIIAGGME